jgi:hypothetical protein
LEQGPDEMPQSAVPGVSWPGKVGPCSSRHRQAGRSAGDEAGARQRQTPMARDAGARGTAAHRALSVLASRLGRTGLRLSSRP